MEVLRLWLWEQFDYCLRLLRLPIRHQSLYGFSLCVWPLSDSSYPNRAFLVLETSDDFVRFLLRRRVLVSIFFEYCGVTTQNSIHPRLHVPLHSTVHSPSKLNTDILPSMSTLLRLHTTRINILRPKLPQIQRTIPLTPPANITPSRLNSHPQSS